jgi:mono/diheme cytochrome c family protein
MNSFVLRIVSKIFFALMITFFFGAVVRADDSASTFKAKCAMCHGADGTGNSPTGKAMKVRDLSSPDVQSQTDAQLTDIVANGKNKMPAYKGKLTDDQIKGLVAYIRGLAKK